MRYRLLIYLVLAIGLQVLLGEVTDKGQGGIAMLLFVVFVELDPKYSFAYLMKRNEQKKD